MKGHYGTVSKKTSCVETLELTAVNSAREWIMHVGSKTSSEITIASIFYKSLKDGSHCEAVICTDNPLIIKYSKSQENIKISLIMDTGTHLVCHNMAYKTMKTYIVLCCFKVHIS